MWFPGLHSDFNLRCYMKSSDADVMVVSASKKSGELSKGTQALIKDAATTCLLIFRPTDSAQTGL